MNVEARSLGGAGIGVKRKIDDSRRSRHANHRPDAWADCNNQVRATSKDQVSRIQQQETETISHPSSPRREGARHL
jgi:hypothetical protein